MPGSGIGRVGNKLLAKERVADLAQIGHQPIEKVFGQAIMEAVHQSAYHRERIELIAKANLRFGERRIPIGIGQNRAAEGVAQMVRYGLGP